MEQPRVDNGICLSLSPLREHPGPRLHHQGVVTESGWAGFQVSEFHV